ncbi:unnamed protein product [Cochlearia groenlandica]
MEKRINLKVSKMVRSSLQSCRPRDLYDVVETRTVTTQTTPSERFLLDKVKTRTTPKHFQSQSQRHDNNNKSCSFSTFSSSHIFPPNPFYDENRSFRDLKTKPKPKKRSKFGSDSLLFASSRFKSSGSWCWSCSEEEEEEEESSEDNDTLFSSRSFSSEYSSKAESFAVVKKSKDPYEDFRTSMVEMIVERQIFGKNELQELLQCFLTLNSLQHHKVIVQVFLEIYSTLFSP